jgi:hypothetical protein
VRGIGKREKKEDLIISVEPYFSMAFVDAVP